MPQFRTKRPAQNPFSREVRIVPRSNVPSGNGSGGASSFLELTDTPGSWGTPGQVPIVNANGNGLEWGTGGGTTFPRLNEIINPDGETIIDGGSTHSAVFRKFSQFNIGSEGSIKLVAKGVMFFESGVQNSITFRTDSTSTFSRMTFEAPDAGNEWIAFRIAQGNPLSAGTPIFQFGIDDESFLQAGYSGHAFLQNEKGVHIIQAPRKTAVFSARTDISRVGIKIQSPRATLDVNGTDGIVPVRGTTGQRPVGPPSGTFRFNTELNGGNGAFEYYEAASSSWIEWGAAAAFPKLNEVLDPDQDTSFKMNGRSLSFGTDEIAGSGNKVSFRFSFFELSGKDNRPYVLASDAPASWGTGKILSWSSTGTPTWIDTPTGVDLLPLDNVWTGTNRFEQSVTLAGVPGGDGSTLIRYSDEDPSAPGRYWLDFRFAGNAYPRGLRLQGQGDGFRFSFDAADGTALTGKTQTANNVADNEFLTKAGAEALFGGGMIDDTVFKKRQTDSADDLWDKTGYASHRPATDAATEAIGHGVTWAISNAVSGAPQFHSDDLAHFYIRARNWSSTNRQITDWYEIHSELTLPGLSVNKLTTDRQVLRFERLDGQATAEIGARNTSPSYFHFQAISSGITKFYFNKPVEAVSSFKIYNSATEMRDDYLNIGTSTTDGLYVDPSANRLEWKGQSLLSSGGDSPFEEPTTGQIQPKNVGALLGQLGGLSFRSKSNPNRYGLFFGTPGVTPTSGTPSADNLVLTNREAHGDIIIATSGSTGGQAGESQRIRIFADGKKYNIYGSAGSHYISIGDIDNSWARFSTNASQFYMADSLQVNGQIRVYSNKCYMADGGFYPMANDAYHAMGQSSRGMRLEYDGRNGGHLTLFAKGAANFTIGPGDYEAGQKWPAIEIQGDAGAATPGSLKDTIFVNLGPGGVKFRGPDGWTNRVVISGTGVITQSGGLTANPSNAHLQWKGVDLVPGGVFKRYLTRTSDTTPSGTRIYINSSTSTSITQIRIPVSALDGVDVDRLNGNFIFLFSGTSTGGIYFVTSVSQSSYYTINVRDVTGTGSHGSTVSIHIMIP